MKTPIRKNTRRTGRRTTSAGVSVRLRRLLLLTITTILFAGCAGGFDADSENAGEFSHDLFGDTTSVPE